MTAILEAKEICVEAGGKLLLDGVSLSVAPGERIAIVGPNGAGKTTLLRAIAGEQRSLRGTVRLKGKPIASYSALALSLHRAVLSQHITVAFPFTVREIVEMGAGDVRGRHAQAFVDRALAEVDLTELADRIVTTLSGGEQQRAHLARILVQLAFGETRYGPGILLLDEPTSSLDLRHQLELVAIAKRSAARGIAVVAVLHDLNLASVFADRVVVLDNGRLVSAGPPAITVTEAMLNDVFRVAGGVSMVAASGLPSVLPHNMTRAG